jgi:hypothetical protein
MCIKPGGECHEAADIDEAADIAEAGDDTPPRRSADVYESWRRGETGPALAVRAPAISG